MQTKIAKLDYIVRLCTRRRRVKSIKSITNIFHFKSQSVASFVYRLTPLVAINVLFLCPPWFWFFNDVTKAFLMNFYRGLRDTTRSVLQIYFISILDKFCLSSYVMNAFSVSAQHYFPIIAATFGVNKVAFSCMKLEILNSVAALFQGKIFYFPTCHAFSK